MHFEISRETIGGSKRYRVDLDRPIDLSIPLEVGSEAVNCFGAPPFAAEPVRAGNWVGSTLEGSPVNFYNLQINPHGNGTHTECIGHITKKRHTINQTLRRFNCWAQVVTVQPDQDGTDQVVRLRQLANQLGQEGTASALRSEAIVIRTLPNGRDKMNRNWTGSNPPYLEAKAATWLAENQFQHLLIDLPSLDREEDGGKLAAHKAWWCYPESPRLGATITEMIYVPEEVPDGLYFLQFQIAPIEIDASPSKIILYSATEM